jgi:Secretion system C-terminal sorting domain
MRYTFALTLMLSLALAMNTSAQFVQQGNKLVGTGAVFSADQGCSVSLSADGNTALVGGFADSLSMGAAWVFTRTAGVWTQQGSKLVGTEAVGNAGQGHSVSLSSDGNTALIGGNTDSSYTGAAWVFTRTGGVWKQQGNKLVGAGAVGAAEQGYSVSLSADGNTALVGGYTDSNHTGAAWVFARTGEVWTQQGGKLVGSGSTGSSYQGISVSISGDGNTAIIGGTADSGSVGAAWVFVRNSGVWTQQGNKLVGTGAVGGALQGYSVSLSSDGNTAIVGGWIDNNNVGAAWVFTRTAGVWTQQGNKLVGSGGVGEAMQGSVSLSSDGNTAIIGGSGDNGTAGAAWIFTRSAGTWTQDGAKLIGSGASGSAEQGASVCLSGDGNTAIVGGSSDSLLRGAVWIFTRNATGVRELTGNIPQRFRLDQNYPNPFNPTTTINYQLPTNSHVTLKVYDVLGREVATLVNESKNGGSYSVTFDGSKLASGVYFYRLEAGKVNDVKKLMLIK